MQRYWRKDSKTRKENPNTAFARGGSRKLSLSFFAAVSRVANPEGCLFSNSTHANYFGFSPDNSEFRFLHMNSDQL